MYLRGLRRTVQRLSAAAALGLLLFAALAAFSPDLSAAAHALLPGVDGTLNAAVAALLGAVAAWVHLMCARGYRRLPFWIAASSGTLLVLAAVGVGGLSVLPVHGGVAIACAGAAFGAARVSMTRTMLNARRFTVLFAAALAGGLLLPGLVAWTPDPAAESLSYQGELDGLLELLHPAYRHYGPHVEDYVEEIAADESLSREEQERLIGELNRQIERLQNDIERYQVVQIEKQAYAEEVERLRRELEQIEPGGIRPEELQRVSSYREAVRPGVPLVRDFAVRLAAEHPGSYYRAPGSVMPGREGLLQVLTIHRYVSASWKYVNDPLVIRGNYYSPADRTIAVGLAGDCDDFATLMASAVEAVGGKARILHGVCADGAHAWAEVYIGDRSAWQQALAVLAQRYPGRRIEYITPRHAADYWLSLDWQVGVYSCGNRPALQYQSG